MRSFTEEILDNVADRLGFNTDEDFTMVLSYKADDWSWSILKCQCCGSADCGPRPATPGSSWSAVSE